MNDHGDETLERLLSEARAAPPAMPRGMLARLEAQALTVQPRAALWRRMVDSIGGWAGLGGLVTATVVGFWIGVAPPDGIATQVDLLLGDDVTMPVLMGAGWDFDEG